MSKFTDAQVTEALNNAAALKGEDYIYKNPEASKATGPVCVYSLKDGTASCIVGHVLKELDPEVFEEIAAWERENEDTPIVSFLEDMRTDLFTYEQGIALQRAQGLQDNRVPWGRARDSAVEIIEKGL